MGSHISHGISHFSVGIWDPTDFPMLPNASYRIPKNGGIQWHKWEAIWEIMGTQMGIDGNYWDELRFPFLPNRLPTEKVK